MIKIIDFAYDYYKPLPIVIVSFHAIKSFQIVIFSANRSKRDELWICIRIRNTN